MKSLVDLLKKRDRWWRSEAGAPNSLVGLVKPVGGLGNRIKPLVSALRFTNKVYTTDKIFNLIFENQFPVVSEYKGECREFSSWRFELKQSDEIGDSFGSVYLQCCPAEEQKRKAIDLEYFRIPEKLRLEISGVFRTLKFSPIVDDAVRRFTKDWKQDVIAVHARSWNETPIRNNELFVLENFFRELDRRDPSMRIFLSTDSLDVTSKFIDRYGGRVLFHPYGASTSDSHIGETTTNTNDEKVIRAFCEMACLSKGDLLIGSYLSTFTECAWYFGGCKQHVVIV